MGRRRGRRTRSDEGGRRVDRDGGFPRFEHNQWTVEGEIERMVEFARGAKSATGAKRWVALSLVALLVGPLIVGILLSVVRLLSAL